VNTQGEYESHDFAYPSYEDYQRRPRGDICAYCGHRISLTPGKLHRWYWMYAGRIPAKVHAECYGK
jgi:hypothetical protein